MKNVVASDLLCILNKYPEDESALKVRNKFWPREEYDPSRDVDSSIFEEYKTKYSISDDMWSIELERLQTLCNGTTDMYEIANYIETNFL